MFEETDKQIRDSINASKEAYMETKEVENFELSQHIMQDLASPESIQDTMSEELRKSPNINIELRSHKGSASVKDKMTIQSLSHKIYKLNEENANLVARAGELNSSLIATNHRISAQNEENINSSANCITLNKRIIDLNGKIRILEKSKQQLNTDNHRLIGNLEVLQQLIFKNDLAEVYPDGEFKIDSDIEDKAALISKSAKKFFSTNFSANSPKKEENSDKKLFHQQLDSIIAELKKLREVNEEYKDQAAYSVDKISSLKAKIEKYKSKEEQSDEAEELRRELNRVRRNSESLKNEKDQLDNEMKRMSIKVSGLETITAKKTAQVSEVQQEMRKLKEQLRLAKN